MVDRWLFASREPRLPVGLLSRQGRANRGAVLLALCSPVPVTAQMLFAPLAACGRALFCFGVRDREELFMKAYAIAAETVKDQAMFDRYRSVVPETLTAFGGHFVVRGGNLTVLEGEWPHPRLVIIEFPSRAAAEGWYRSAEYQKVISLRLNSSVGNLIIVDGSP